MLNWLCTDKIGLAWAHDTISFACHMSMHSHAYVLYFQYTCYLKCVWSFSDCLFLPSFSLVYVSRVYGTKTKSTPSQNPLCSRALSSSDPTSHIWFRDKDARKDFLENFSRRGVHSECRVILANFTDTELPNVIHSQGRESLCDIPVRCHSMLI